MRRRGYTYRVSNPGPITVLAMFLAIFLANVLIWGGIIAGILLLVKWIIL
jgi:hypothetical protein